VSAIDFAKKLKLWSTRGFRELGDFAGMGQGATTGKVLNHHLYLTDPHQVSVLIIIHDSRIFYTVCLILMQKYEK